MRPARPDLQFVEVVPRAGGSAAAPVPPPLRVQLRDVVVEVAPGFDAARRGAAGGARMLHLASRGRVFVAIAPFNVTARSTASLVRSAVSFWTRSKDTPTSSATPGEQ
jgi:hypothetical protein